jgi:hypothetical protein
MELDNEVIQRIGKLLDRKTKAGDMNPRPL